MRAGCRVGPPASRCNTPENPSKWSQTAAFLPEPCAIPLKRWYSASKTAEIASMPSETPQIEAPTFVSRLGLSTSQAARELGVSLGTIRRWADMGYLKSYRTPGGQRRFNPDQIDHFVQS